MLNYNKDKINYLKTTFKHNPYENNVNNKLKLLPNQAKMSSNIYYISHYTLTKISIS